MVLKKHRFFYLFLILLYLMFAQGSLAAQETDQLDMELQVEYVFGQIMRFKLLTNTDEPVKKVTLFLSAPELSNTLTAEIPVTPGKQLDLEYSIDLTQLRLAPFTTVTYWWVIEEQSGTTIATPEEHFDYVDDQYDWRILEKDGVVVHWTGEDVVIGQAAMDAVSDALPKVQAIIPLEPPIPLNVYVYPSASDLRAALRLTGRDWIGAHAHPELGVILVSATNPRTAAAELSESIPHELGHLLIYEATGVGYESVPLWFEEGLATYFENKPKSDYDSILQEEASSGVIFEFEELCRSFPNESQQAVLAYAQSASFVRFIQEQYGNFALGQMVAALADGADCQSLTDRALGVSLEELSEDWLGRHAPQSRTSKIWQEGGILIIAIVVGFVLMSLFVVGLPRMKN